MRNIVVVPHDPNWAQAFAAEAARLQPVFGENLVAIHHIGSTSIPGIFAKPVIDILPLVRDIHAVDALNPLMEALGYQPKGEYGIPGRRFFLKEIAEVRSHHVHVFQEGDSEVTRHIHFAAYLRAHPAEAQEYSQLKITLAQQFPHDIESYCAGKDAFIHALDEKARRWVERRR